MGKKRHSAREVVRRSTEVPKPVGKIGSKGDLQMQMCRCLVTRKPI